MTKRYIIMLEYREDGQLVLEWLLEAHFKTWSVAGQPTPLKTAIPFFISVICSDDRFEPWIAAKLATSLKDLTASVRYYIQLN